MNRDGGDTDGYSKNSPKLQNHLQEIARTSGATQHAEVSTRVETGTRTFNNPREQTENMMDLTVRIIVPTTGERRSLRDVIEVVLESVDPSCTVTIAASGQDVRDRVVNLLSTPTTNCPGDEWPEILDVPSGYASARNAMPQTLAHIETGGGYLFVDDDLNLDSSDIRMALGEISKMPNSILAMDIPLRYSVDTRSTRYLASRLKVKGPKGVQATELPAKFLYLPVSVFRSGFQFPIALDETGGEDTILTRQLRDNGYSLALIKSYRSYEEWPPERCDDRSLLYRNLINSTILGVDRRRAKNSSIHLGRVIPGSEAFVGLILAIVLASSRISMTLAFTLTRILGQALGLCGIIPVRNKNRRRLANLIFRDRNSAMDTPDDSVERGGRHHGRA
ncbi:hypothetical protein C8E05_2410 [Rhodococcus wratislaviensis]|uniref:Glycosyltransferase n=2 Tax=Rhodococcus wratislaviensis TaxID=44752 RepID=A0AB38FGW2_RHOWR|nr:hypothetical protein C8E05_2410 [Rhodococcus wratislaviensis]SPZ40844.1 Uncharacterised protein [Rhodococcus wratislaviensis]